MITGDNEQQIADDPDGAARQAAAGYGAVVVLKGSYTVSAGPDGMLLH